MADPVPTVIRADYRSDAMPGSVTWEHDKAGRRVFGDNLSALIEHARSSATVAIDAPWGMGKTHFLSALVEGLPQTVPYVVVNAWETDFLDDPLMAVAHKLSEHISNATPTSKVAKEAFVKSAVAVKDSVLTNVSDLVLKQLTAGIITGADAAKVAEAISGARSRLANPTGEYALEEMRAAGQRIKAVQHFRESLETYASGVRQADESAPPLLIVIDELDRCRPTWAVSMLERVKHLFSVPGVFFLIAIDRQQLAESIKSVYGMGFDADRYLRRFIDVTFPLPLATDGVRGFVRHAIGQANMAPPAVQNAHLEDLLMASIHAGRLDFRSTQQLLLRLQICMSMMRPPNGSFWNERHALIIDIMLILAQANPSLYQQVCSRDADGDEVYEALGPPPGVDPPFIMERSGRSSITKLNVIIANMLGPSYCGALYKRLDALGDDEQEVLQRRVGPRTHWQPLEAQHWSVLMQYLDFAKSAI